MKINVNGGKFEFIIEGAISENADIFDYKIADATEIIIDFDKLTFINSIGVKKWTLWAVKIPVKATVQMKNCPGLILNQIHMIQGFMPRKGRVVSLKAPYLCSECSYEKEYYFTVGKEFTYPTAGAVRSLNLPTDLKCPKCNGEMEKDFIDSRFFSFLDLALG